MERPDRAETSRFTQIGLVVLIELSAKKVPIVESCREFEFTWRACVLLDEGVEAPMPGTQPPPRHERDLNCDRSVDEAARARRPT
jgi:hypothetical protein